MRSISSTTKPRQQITAVKDNLREQFAQQVGQEGLRARMTAFQREVIDIYQRWPGCAACDAPCTYLSEDNAPCETTTEAFQRFVQSTLLAQPATVRAEWGRARSALAARLARRYGGAPAAPGVERCAAIQLVRACLQERLRYYNGGTGGYRSAISLEQRLLAAIEGLSAEDVMPSSASTAMVDFLAEMRGQIALDPRRAELGCRFCRRPCWYGFTVQRDLQPKARLLADLLKEAAAQEGFAGNYPRLVELVKNFTVEVTPFRVSPGHLHHLAYCYLANAGAQRTHILQGFQAQMNITHD